MKDFIKIGEESTDELNEIFLKYTKQTEKVLKIEVNKDTIFYNNIL